MTNRLAGRYSGRLLLSVGLAIATLGNIGFWLVARSHLPYNFFLVAMLIAGSGAGLLNGQTVKVIQGAVPEERAGMASGLASTTRFIGILVSVAGLGAVLSDVTRSGFVGAATRFGLSAPEANEAASRVTSGALSDMLASVPAGSREALHAAALSAYSSGFASAALVAAVTAFVASLLALFLIRESDTAPAPAKIPAKLPCKFIDCRDPL
jgi:hypothetical protein